MAVQGVSGTAVAATAAGAVLVWSGLKGGHVSASLKSLISGNAPSGANAEPIGTPAGSGSASSPASSPASGGLAGGTASENRALGQQMCAAVGWTGTQWAAFDWIATEESGWSDTVLNTEGSGAAGIAQNISGFGPDYQSGNARQQIAWMITYIQGRYGTPVAAKAFHLEHGSY